MQLVSRNIVIDGFCASFPRSKEFHKSIFDTFAMLQEFNEALALLPSPTVSTPTHMLSPASLSTQSSSQSTTPSWMMSSSPSPPEFWMSSGTSQTDSDSDSSIMQFNHHHDEAPHYPDNDVASFDDLLDEINILADSESESDMYADSDSDGHATFAFNNFDVHHDEVYDPAFSSDSPVTNFMQ